MQYNKALYLTVEGRDLQYNLEEGYEIVTQWIETTNNTQNIDLNGNFMGNSISVNGYASLPNVHTKFLLKLTKEAQILYAPPNQPNAKEILSFGDQIENK